jgi:hypothetical protein
LRFSTERTHRSRSLSSAARTPLLLIVIPDTFYPLTKGKITHCDEVCEVGPNFRWKRHPLPASRRVGEASNGAKIRQMLAYFYLSFPRGAQQERKCQIGTPDEPKGGQARTAENADGKHRNHRF